MANLKQRLEKLEEQQGTNPVYVFADLGESVEDAIQRAGIEDSADVTVLRWQE